MVKIKLCLRLKDKNSCDGCSIYRNAKVFDFWMCPVGNWRVEHNHKTDKTWYGTPVRPKECKRREIK